MRRVNGKGIAVGRYGGGVAAIVLLSFLLEGCARVEEVELPPVHQAAWASEPDLCIPLPPPPMLPPEEAPSDPRACLPRSWTGDGLPVTVNIARGRVVSFEFYSQCSGEHTDVAPAVRECIERSLSTWRYTVWPTCPSDTEPQHFDVLYLRPLRSDTRLAATGRGCGGTTPG